MLQMTGAFAEFERAMIQARLHARLARAKANGKKLGRPLNNAEAVAALREGMGINRVAKSAGLSNGTVAKLKAEIESLRERNHWLDQQVTTLRQQRDRLALVGH